MGKTFKDFVDESKTRIRETSVAETAQKIALSKSIIVDVREDSEWQRGHLPKAIHLGRGVLERDANKVLPDFSAEIICYCGGGSRSALAADTLRQMGYTNVFSMAGGFGAWSKEGHGIES